MSINLSGAQLAAARKLVGVSRAKLSYRADVEPGFIKRIEAAGHAVLPETDELRRLAGALESLGAVFIAEAEGRGVGVRLKFSRGAAGAIGSWESEGGLPADDEVR